MQSFELITILESSITTHMECNVVGRAAVALHEARWAGAGCVNAAARGRDEGGREAGAPLSMSLTDSIFATYPSNTAAPPRNKKKYESG